MSESTYYGIFIKEWACPDCDWFESVKILQAATKRCRPVCPHCGSEDIDRVIGEFQIKETTRRFWLFFKATETEVIGFRRKGEP